MINGTKINCDWKEVTLESAVLVLVMVVQVGVVCCSQQQPRQQHL